MLAYLFVSPFLPCKPISLEKIGSLEFQSTLYFAFRNLRETPDLLLEVALGHGPKGPWSPTPGIVFLVKPQV